MLVRRGAVGTLQLLYVVRSQYRRIERDGHLVDGAGEFERHLVVIIIHRRCAGAADIEGLIERLDQGKGMLERLGRYYLAVHLQRSGSALADTAQNVVRQRRLAESVVFEVIFDRMLARGQGL